MIDQRPHDRHGSVTACSACPGPSPSSDSSMPQCERPEIGSVPPCCPALRVAAPPDRDQPGACKCSICQLGHDAGLRWLDSASPDPVTLGTPRGSDDPRYGAGQLRAHRGFPEFQDSTDLSTLDSLTPSGTMESRSQDCATRACRQRRLPGDSTDQKQGDPKSKTRGHTLEETKNDQRTSLKFPEQFATNSPEQFTALGISTTRSSTGPAGRMTPRCSDACPPCPAGDTRPRNEKQRDEVARGATVHRACSPRLPPPP